MVTIEDNQRSALPNEGRIPKLTAVKTGTVTRLAKIDWIGIENASEVEPEKWDAT